MAINSFMSNLADTVSIVPNFLLYMWAITMSSHILILIEICLVLGS